MSSKDVSASKKSSSVSSTSKSTIKAAATKIVASKKPASPSKVKPSPKAKSLANSVEDHASESQTLGSIAEVKPKKTSAVKTKQVDHGNVGASEPAFFAAQMDKNIETKTYLAPEKKGNSQSESGSKSALPTERKSIPEFPSNSMDGLKPSLAANEKSESNKDGKKEAPTQVLEPVQPHAHGNGNGNGTTESGEFSKHKMESSPSLSSSRDGKNDRQNGHVSREDQRHAAPARQNETVRSSETRHDSQNYNRNPNYRQDRHSSGDGSHFSSFQQGQMKVQGNRNDGVYQKQGGNSNQGSFNQDNYLEIKISGSLYRKLKELSRSEGLTVDELANELVTEGCVVRAWELVERKAAMKTPVGNTTHNGGTHSGNGRSSPNFNSNNKQNYNPKSKQGRSNYNKIMEDNAHFLEYVRNQEKRQR